MTRVAFADLPGPVAQLIQETVGGMSAHLQVVIDWESSPIQEDQEVFHAYAVLNGRLIHMMLSGTPPFDSLSEYSTATALVRIQNVEIRDEQATLTVDDGDDEKGPYTTGVPAETARQILQTGESGNPPLPIAEFLKSD